MKYIKNIEHLSEFLKAKDEIEKILERGQFIRWWKVDGDRIEICYRDYNRFEDYDYDYIPLSSLFEQGD